MSNQFNENDRNMCMTHRGLRIKICSDGSKIMYYKKKYIIDQENIQPEIIECDRTITKCKRVARKSDPEFNSLSDEEKQIKLNTETTTPIDVSQEAICYLYEVGKDKRNAIIRMMECLTSDQKARVKSYIKYYGMKHDKKELENLVSKH
jgi:hypothetical protein